MRKFFKVYPCRKRTPGGISTAYPCGKRSSRGIGIVGKDQSCLSVMTVAHDDSGRFLLMERRDRIEGTKPVEICNLTRRGNSLKEKGIMIEQRIRLNWEMENVLDGGMVSRGGIVPTIRINRGRARASPTSQSDSQKGRQFPPHRSRRCVTRLGLCGKEWFLVLVHSTEPGFCSSVSLS